MKVNTMISSQQKRSLENFKNKVVTFITGPINRNFTEEILINYFVGKVKSIEDYGITYEHVVTKALNFIFYDKIITIAEESYKEEACKEETTIKEEPSKE